MFGKVGSGMCRLSMNGGIAVKTNGGYKTYNIKTGKLTNCSNFVFDIGEEFFFIIPTNKVEKGDIILVMVSQDVLLKPIRQRLRSLIMRTQQSKLYFLKDMYLWVIHIFMARLFQCLAVTLSRVRKVQTIS